MFFIDDVYFLRMELMTALRLFYCIEMSGNVFLNIQTTKLVETFHNWDSRERLTCLSLSTFRKS